MESSSPAAALGPGDSIKHIHQTFHLKGNKEELDEIAKKLLGIGLDSISL